MKDTIRQFKTTAIVVVIVIGLVLGIYNFGVARGRQQQQKDIEDQIFKACAITAEDCTNMTIGDVRYKISIEH